MRTAFRFILSFSLSLALETTAFTATTPDSKGDSELETARKAVEARSRSQMLNFFLGKPKAASSAIETHMAIDLYNQAVEFYRKKEYGLAREVLEDALTYDPKNPFVYELLGDIAYYQQKLGEAEEHYEAAFGLRGRRDLQEKLLKLKKEKSVESGLATYGEEHFIIQYAGEDRGIEGFELQGLLRKAYREVGQDLGYFFKHKVVVLLYEEEAFRELSGAPHWSTGLYDGKIRFPAYQKGFTQKELEKIIRHELTHAFVAEISGGLCPPWLNEGLAEFEEAKVEAPDLRVFHAAVKTRTLFTIDELLDRKRVLEIIDPLEAQLFYVQAYHLVNYLVKRHGLFLVKRMLQLFSQGKDSLEVVGEVLKISPLELEQQWKATF